MAIWTECRVRHIALGLKGLSLGQAGHCVPELHGLAAPREHMAAVGAEQGPPDAARMPNSWPNRAARGEEVVNLGPLALIQPLLDQLDIASIIDRHLPPDPQLEFSHGQVLSLLLAA